MPHTPQKVEAPHALNQRSPAEGKGKGRVGAKSDYLLTKDEERRGASPLIGYFLHLFSPSGGIVGNALWGRFYMYKMLTGKVSLVGMKLFH